MSDTKDYGEKWKIFHRIDKADYSRGKGAPAEVRASDGTLIYPIGKEQNFASDDLSHAVACVNACRGIDPQESLYRVKAWDLRNNPFLGFMWIGTRGFGFHKDRFEEPEIWYNTEAEAICRAAVAEGIELNGKKLTEEDLKI